MNHSRSDPVMIMVAPNGARRGKSDHPALPITTEEVATEAERARAAGASAVHLHVRDGKAAHVLDAGLYTDAISAVKAASNGELVVQITTEAVGAYTPEEQMAVVRDVEPVAVSIALRELVPDNGYAEIARSFCVWMQARRIAPQFILYDAEDVSRFFALCAADTIPFVNPFLLFVLGRYSAEQQSAPADLEPFLDALGDRDVPWAMCAFGGRELECAEAAMRAGGHVRIGFENNLHMPDGSLAQSNAALVSATAERARRIGFDVMTTEQARIFFADTLV